jgi:hypothetical protein
MNAREWIDAFAAEIGAEPTTNDEMNELLDLAATAAHASERIAAPIACYIAGRDGRSITELHAAAQRVEGG